MEILRSGRPDVKKLARREDLQGLVEAAAFQDIVSSRDGPPDDVGIPIREEAIGALGALGPSTGNETVIAALRDPSDRVRVAAVRVLYSRGEADPLMEALTWLPADTGHSRQLALRAVLELAETDRARTLAKALVRRAGDDPVGEEEAQLLKSLIDDEESAEAAQEVVEELIVALSDERDTVADRAAGLLVSLAPVSTQGLIAELDAGAVPHRAAHVLSQVKDTRALEPLWRALGHDDPRVRSESAAALGELRDPAAVEALLRATRDPEHVVRTQASRALDQIGIVAVVVGVSALMRPMIHEAIGSAEARPAVESSLPAPGATAEEGGRDPDAPNPSRASAARQMNGSLKAVPSGENRPAKGASKRPPSAENRPAKGASKRPPSAEK